MGCSKSAWFCICWVWRSSWCWGCRSRIGWIVGITHTYILALFMFCCLALFLTQKMNINCFQGGAVEHEFESKCPQVDPAEMIVSEVAVVAMAEEAVAVAEVVAVAVATDTGMFTIMLVTKICLIQNKTFPSTNKYCFSRMVSALI